MHFSVWEEWSAHKTLSYAGVAENSLNRSVIAGDEKNKNNLESLKVVLKKKKNQFH